MNRTYLELLPRSAVKRAYRRNRLPSTLHLPRYLPTLVSAPPAPAHLQHRSIFNVFKPKKPKTTYVPLPITATPLLTPNDLFHELQSSPIPALRQKAETIKRLAPCPVCLEEQQELAKISADEEGGNEEDSQDAIARIRQAARKVDFTCPDCGFPTHCSEEHWVKGKKEHEEYCERLREINEDEHDLRSGRTLTEFELPGPQDYESTASLASWDTFFYTRSFPSIDTERSRRHVSKLLTYPITIAAVLHQTGPYSTSSGKLTREGIRSVTALHTSLHPPIGSPPSPDARNTKIPIRIFVLGARAESSLPPHVYEQINFLFPFTQFQIFFIGPQAALPSRPDTSLSNPNMKSKPGESIYSPETPNQSSETYGKGYMDTSSYGPDILSYTYSANPTLHLVTIQAPYEKVHHNFGPFDPYTDVFFSFCPGFGFPSPTVPGTLQAESEWKQVLDLVMETKCALFVTGFSPRDVERDVKSMDVVEGIKSEYDLILEPGENIFSSLKWEAGEFDPRVLVRVNWGVWGIRGKRYEVKVEGKEDD